MQVNWQKIALDLRKHGGLHGHSKRLGLAKGYLGQMSRGEIQEPRYSIGLILLDYHKRLNTECNHGE